MTGVDAVPAGSAKRRSDSRAATGLHSQALDQARLRRAPQDDGPGNTIPTFELTFSPCY